MGKINSKQKGKSGELEWVHFLKDRGVDARRGVQYSGEIGSPDVISDFEGFHFEVKRTERLALYKALFQAIEDCGTKTPVVAHRQNRKDWVVVLRADDFVELLKKHGYHKKGGVVV